MNQDFAILATPAIARRLLLLKQRNSKICLPNGIEELAKQDCITETDFDQFVCPFTPERQTITQFLLDSDMRGIVQAPYHPAIDECTIMNLVRLTQRKLTILSLRRSVWRKAVAAFNLPDVSIQSPHEISGRDIDARRNGNLIVDLHQPYGRNGQQFVKSGIMREFPRTLLYQPADKDAQIIPWAGLAATLFPTMPDPRATRMMQNNPPHWTSMQLINFAIFYNVCIFPEYITSSELLDSLKE